MAAGLIAVCTPGSLAERVGLQPGDELLSINAHPLRDVIDVRFYGAENHLTLRVRRGEREFTIAAERRYGELLGLEFVQPTFDGIHRCSNRCDFCFVAQMPPGRGQSRGLRRSLYVKDDDYRYSFLFGSYVTLTNLRAADWQRIGEQHLSPLYISVHATDLDLRRSMLGNSAVPDVMDQLGRLADLGIETHTQIVVTPGRNDGPQLDRSIDDLADLYPTVRSVSVVPVGLTKFHGGNCRVHTVGEARDIFDLVVDWQERLRLRLGVNFCYLSDEWYLRLDKEVPPAKAYDGLDLTENGVGLVRKFLNSQFGATAAVAVRNSQFATLTLVTGTLFAPVLRRAVAEFAGVEVVPVVNHFFGKTVTVAGLLAGQDVVAQLRERDLGDAVALPPAMFGGPEGQSLDEMYPQEIGQILGREVVVEENLPGALLWSFS